jgi:hypothetical protein
MGPIARHKGGYVLLTGSGYPAFGNQDCFNGSPIIIEVFEDTLSVSESILNFVISNFSPIVMENVVNEHLHVLFFGGPL